MALIHEGVQYYGSTSTSQATLIFSPQNAVSKWLNSSNMMGWRHKIVENKSRLIRTFAVCLSFIGLGGSMTLLGASLLDLQVRIQETFSDTSRLILVKSLGYFIGGSLVGFVEKYLSDSLALFVGNVVSGVFIMLAPWGTDFWWVASFIFIANIGQGLVDLYCNLSVLHIWGDKASNFMQALHMCFGIGSLLTPLITRSFYLPLEQNSANATKTQHLQYGPEDVQVQWAFMILGGYSIFVGLIFFYYTLSDHHKKQSEMDRAKSETNDANEIPTWKMYCAVAMVSVMAHIAFGVEFIIGNLAQAFGVKSELHMDKKSAALLVTAFWTCFSFFKVVFIPLTLYFGEKRMVYFNLFVMGISVVIMVPHAAYTQLYTWMSFTLLGIGYSPLFAIAYASLESYFRVNARQTAIIFVAGVMGESIHPPLIGHFMETYPNLFIFYLGAVSLLFMFTMLIMPFICRKLFEASSKTAIREGS